MSSIPTEYLEMSRVGSTRVPDGVVQPPHGVGRVAPTVTKLTILN